MNHSDGTATDQTSLIIRDDVIDCLMMGGIIANELEPRAKLWLLWRWHKSGCSHRWMPYHPNLVIEIGYSDPETGEQLMRLAEEAGYVDVLPDPERRGWYRIRITYRIWMLPRENGGQMVLFDRWSGELPPFFGQLARLPHLMIPYPLVTTDRLELSPTATLIAWITRLTSPPGREAIVQHGPFGQLLRLHRAQILRAIRRLHDRQWCVLQTQGNGQSKLSWNGDVRQYWDPSQIRELQDFRDCDPRAANRLLAIVLGGDQPRAPSPDGAHALPAPIDPPRAPSPGGAHALPPPTDASRAPGPDGAHGLPGTRAPSPDGAHAPQDKDKRSYPTQSDRIESDVANRIEERAARVKKSVQNFPNMAGWMPRLYAALVEDRGLTETQLDRIIKRASGKRGPGGPGAYLTSAIQGEVGRERVCEAHARVVLERYGIPWAPDMDTDLVPTSTGSVDDACETDAEKLRKMHFECRQWARREKPPIPANRADEVFVRTAVANGYDEAEARKLIE